MDYANFSEKNSSVIQKSCHHLGHSERKQHFSLVLCSLIRTFAGVINLWCYFKHYFAYFDRDLGVRTILAMRKMKNGGPYKPYAIIDQYAFEKNIGELQKGTPL